MIFRVFYAIWQGGRHHQKLRSYKFDPALSVENIQSLDPNVLKAQGIKVLAVDFDGVLASYGEELPFSVTEDWLKQSLQVFGNDNVFILSNKPTQERQKFFLDHGIGWIKASKKKPYPHGLITIIEKTRIQPKDLLILDDRLLTGILAAEIAGTRAIWIKKPYVNIRKRPIPELLFMLLRGIERLLF